MKCSPKYKELTKKLHILSLLVTMIGTSIQFYYLMNNQSKPYILSFSLIVFLLLRIPNQICVAYVDSDGWYTVFGTVLGILSFSIISILEYKKEKESTTDDTRIN
jgi:hypothetical protein